MSSRLALGALLAGVFCLAQGKPGNGNIDPTPVGRDTYYYSGHRYTFFRERLTWDEASVVCRAGGGYLAVIEDILEAEFLAEAMSSNICNFYVYQHVWIGGRFIDNRWIWVPTGQEIPSKIGENGYPPWANNVRPDMNCLTLTRRFFNRPSFVDLTCPKTRNFICEYGCAALQDTDRGTWQPPTCSEGLSEVGDLCTFQCMEGYELSGSEQLLCTPDGWNGTAGFNNLPSCKTPEEVGEDFVDKINSTVNGIKANLLFLLDESVSVSPEQFDLEKQFTTAAIKAFPLSENRTAGVITFSHVADTDIPLNENNTCNFVQKMDTIQYTKGGTSLQVVLNKAIDEINANAVHNTTLVFLITDGISTTDPTPPADIIKANNNIIFTLGIADYQRDQLEPLASVGPDGTPNFFAISSFAVFEVVSNYLNTTYANNNHLEC